MCWFAEPKQKEEHKKGPSEGEQVSKVREMFVLIRVTSR